MNLKTITKSTLLIFMTPLVYGNNSVFLQNNYYNINQDSSKNALMVGANTATAKGYAALLTNPAGLSTHHNKALYVKTTMTQTYADDDKKITETKPQNQITIGAIYNSYAIEYKLDDYAALGLAYGYETRYGLFSIGASYLLDTTKRITIENSKDAKETSGDEYVSGNYNTIGFMWQKSFIGIDRFYAIYLGVSRKSSGKYTGSDGNKNIIPISPIKINYGLGLETNLFATTILVTLDYSNETWKSISESRSGLAYGIKWMILDKLSIAAGMAYQTNEGNLLGNIDSIGGGVEYSIWGLHFNGSLLQRTTKEADGDLYLKDISTHLDVALSF